MKAQRILFFLMAVGILASCSTSKDVVTDRWIQKRKYNKGYFVTKRSQTPEIDAKADEAVAIETPDAAIARDAYTAEVISIPRSEMKEAIALTPRTSAEQDRSQPVSANVAETTVEELPTADFEQGRRRITNMAETAISFDDTQATDDTEMLLYLIIAFFIAWLAVGLLYDWGTEFLIALILWLLFWLPGAIYGIIKVLQYYGKL